MKRVIIDIKLMRFFKNLTQQQFASIIGTTQDKISRSEQSGKVDLDDVLTIGSVFSPRKTDFDTFTEVINNFSPIGSKYEYNANVAIKCPHHYSLDPVVDYTKEYYDRVRKLAE